MSYFLGKVLDLGQSTHSLPCECAVAPRTIGWQDHFSWELVLHLCQKQLGMFVWVSFWDYSLPLFCVSVLVLVKLDNCSSVEVRKVRIMSSSNLYFFSNSFLTILDPLYFHVNLTWEELLSLRFWWRVYKICKSV